MPCLKDLLSHLIPSLRASHAARPTTLSQGCAEHFRRPLAAGALEFILAGRKAYEVKRGGPASLERRPKA